MQPFLSQAFSPAGPVTITSSLLCHIHWLNGKGINTKPQVADFLIDKTIVNDRTFLTRKMPI
jgi:hypothetical protein